MDARSFDRLTRALSEASTRRRLLALLPTLPVLSGLIALDDDAVDAKGRRKRRKKRHKHGNGRRRTQCQPNSRTRTCSGGKCGPVRNNCKQTVDCGSCDCPAPCDTCFVCQGGPNAPGVCVPDPEQNGEPCGLGRRCNDLGQCVCDSVSCPSGCCDAQGQCQIDNDDSCAASGASCGTAAVCAGGQVCRGGICMLCSAACPNCDYCLRQINGISICSDSNELNCNTVPCSLSSCAAKPGPPAVPPHPQVMRRSQSRERVLRHRQSGACGWSTPNQPARDRFEPEFADAARGSTCVLSRLGQTMVRRDNTND